MTTLRSVSSAWRNLWRATAVLGVGLLAIGIVDWIGSHDFCDAGSHYEYFWLTAGAAFSIVSVVALGAGRSESVSAVGRRTINIVLALMLIAVAAVVVLIGDGAISLPWLEQQDIPGIGSSVACGYG